jgi:hypothetical protein
LLAVFAGVGLSCHKQAQPPASHLLGNFYQQNQGLFIGQAAEPYDSTALNDSLLIVQPPTDRIYRWIISPDSGAAVLGDDYLHGRAQLIFKAAGTYQVSAVIYDSATNKELARTNTMSFQVGPDTLYSQTPMAKNDQLSIGANGYSYTGGDNVPDDYQLGLSFTTTGTYYSNDVIPYTVSTDNGITISFSDSASLQGYPYYSGWAGPIESFVTLPKIPVGTTEAFSVVWLGVTYTGAISRTNASLLFISWDNSQPVKVTNGGYINE